jgi:hypothetical protein
MEKKEGIAEESSVRNEKLKKVLTWVAVAGGIGALGFLLLYAPGENSPSKEPVPMPVSDVKEGTPKAKAPSNLKGLDSLEFFTDEGQEHVPDGTKVIYKTSPPTSGRHYARWIPPGVHEIEKTTPELLVHNLEHGNVVIYFDRDQLPKQELDILLELPKKYPGQWDGVVLVNQKGVVPPLIFTAWRVKMPLNGYDTKKADQFLDSFRGRGPEHPIR